MGDVVLTYDLPCSAAQAFLVYVDRIGSWWPAGHTRDPGDFETIVIEPRVGGAVRARFGDQQDRWGTVQRLDPPHALEHTLSSSTRIQDPVGLVRVEFTENDRGCRMTFTHSGGGSPQASPSGRPGDWPVILAGFVEAVRGTMPRPR